MNKQFIITNFAAFALMLFLPTGCRQADGKQDAVQSYRPDFVTHKIRIL